jgi:hypothetical protein
VTRNEYLDIEKVPAGETTGPVRSRAEAMEEARKNRESLAQNVTQGLLAEAIAEGYPVAEETKEALVVQEEPAPEAPVTPEPDAVDQILASMEADQNIVEVEDDEEEEVEVLPDFEAEAEREIIDMEIAAAEGEYDDSELTEEALAERKRRIIAEKKAAHFENLTATRERKKWEAEVLKHYPFSKHALPNIKATSRRAFLKEAKAAHDAVKPYIKETVNKLVAESEEERAGLAAQERARAEAAWGKPLVGGGTGEGNPAAAKHWQAWETAREKNDLAAMIVARAYAEAEEEQ